MDYQVVERNRTQQQQLYKIMKPCTNDVLSGRGNVINNHPGNVYFQSLVKSIKYQYVRSRKEDKPVFATYIVNHMKSLNPPGRFLKLDKSTGFWYDIGNKKALSKTRQALREGAPEIEKSLQEQKSQTKADETSCSNGIGTCIPPSRMCSRHESHSHSPSLPSISSLSLPSVSKNLHSQHITKSINDRTKNEIFEPNSDNPNTITNASGKQVLQQDTHAHPDRCYDDKEHVNNITKMETTRRKNLLGNAHVHVHRSEIYPQLQAQEIYTTNKLESRAVWEVMEALLMMKNSSNR